MGSSATKRDAKAYIQRFTPPKETPKVKPILPTDDTVPISKGNAVNLGGFYRTVRAVAESPKFVQQPVRETSVAAQPQLHVALVKIRAPQTLSDETLHGVGLTLSQLNRLGLTSVVVVDCGEEIQNDPNADPRWRSNAEKEANRIVTAIDAHGGAGARLVNNVLGITEVADETGMPAYLKGDTYITMRKLLMIPLRRGTIPVIPCLGYTDITQNLVLLPANDVVLALTREFAGLRAIPSSAEDPKVANKRLQTLQREVSLDRLILLDPLGGIPASDRENGYHVFLNMEQEFEDAKADLTSKMKQSIIKSPNVAGKTLPSFANSIRESESKQHIMNLELARSVLSILPPSSSALLTTPDEAANSGKVPDTPFQAGGVGTRRQRNPLIHNLLTDKPVFSSSLPVGRIGRPPTSQTKSDISTLGSTTPTTFAKHGMSVTIFPDPKTSPWEPPGPGKPQLALTDSCIDLPRLVNLIEDSFGRKLDVQDYLKRVNNRVAGVIIAGEYEGGALLTWETPPGVIDDGSPESRARMVPYLDKFAVLKRSQGSGGTADVVFKAMVRDCFPAGVCWRSRKTNVVNKWYFERSRGTWKLPDSGWTMFWTTPDLSLDPQRFRDYEDVCRNIEPSWADNKALLD